MVEECQGFCYFQVSDPVECTLAIANEESGMCFLGSFESTSSEYSDENGLTSDTNYLGTRQTEFFNTPWAFDMLCGFVF